MIGVWTTNALELIRISLGVSATRMFGMVSAWIDRAVVMTFFSASALGVYVAGAWEVPFMAIFFGAITAAIVPEMSDHWGAGRREDALAVWKGAVSRSAWLIFPLWIWALLWAPELIRVLFTTTYGDAVPIFRAYLLMLPLRVAVFGAFLVAIGEVRAMIVGAAIDVAVNLCASVVLATSVGMIGPALATALGTYAQVGYYLVFIRRRLQLTFGEILPWRDLTKAIVVALAVIAPTVAARMWLESDAAVLIVSAAFVGTVFATLAYYGVGGLFVRRSSRAR
jgi:O-antigen/teichoic acid export membrane protein